MDRLGDQLLTGTTLALDKNRCTGIPKIFDQPVDFINAFTTANDDPKPFPVYPGPGFVFPGIMRDAHFPGYAQQDGIDILL